MKRRTPTPSQKRVKKHKAKSRWLQNWVAEKISWLTECPWGPDTDIEPRRMGQMGVDVMLRGIPEILFPFVIECASGEKISWTSKIRQAKEYQRKSKMKKDWLVFLKRKEFQSPVVLMDAKVFFDLMKKLEGFEEWQKLTGL